MRASRNRILTVLIAGGLAVMLVWYTYAYLARKGFVKQRSDADFVELMGRTPASFVSPNIRRFSSGHFQETIEQAARDRFPYFSTVVPAYGGAAEQFHRWVLALLPPTWRPLMPISDDVLELPNQRRLAQVPATYSSTHRISQTERADYYQQLATECPDSRVSVIGVLVAGNWLADSTYCQDVTAGVLAGERNCREFGDQLDRDIGYTWIGKGLASPAALNLYYRTDHHFAMRGAYQAYRQIIDLLAVGMPAIGMPLQPQRWFTLPDIQFRGSLARRAIGFERFADHFEDAEFNLPAYQISMSGHESGIRNARQSYLAGDVPTGPFANHYAEYFGIDHGVIEYTNLRSPNRNLLVVGDSFDNCLEPLLAAHYRRSLFIDPRAYAVETGKELDVVALASEHEIDDIVFLGDYRWVLGLRKAGFE